MKPYSVSETTIQATTTVPEGPKRKRSRPARSRNLIKPQPQEFIEATGEEGAAAAAAAVAKAKSASAAQSVAHSADDLPRCKWAGMYRGAAAADYVRYHDDEWGRPLHDDCKLFELLVLEGAQAGLSWATILGKRQAYRDAFMGFDPAKVAAFDAAAVEALLAEGSGVVRHKGKLASAVRNAQVVLELQRQHGSFASFVWGFAPNRQPIVGGWSSMAQVPTTTPEAAALSKALKQAGMSFVGPTTCYSFMQAAGLANDHTVDCHCYQAILDSYSEQQQQQQQQQQQGDQFGEGSAAAAAAQAASRSGEVARRQKGMRSRNKASRS